MKCRHIFLLFLFFVSSFQGQDLKAFGKSSSSNKASKSQNPWQESLNLNAKLFRQADAVVREMGWVVSGLRKPAGSSPFGRLQRAFIKEGHGKLPKSLVLKCDSYKIKNLGPEAELSKAEIFETCNSKYPLLLASLSLKKTDHLQIDFYPMNLAEELGLIASVMNKKTHCDLDFRGAILKGMDCQNWAQDRSKTEVVDLSTFVYTADQESLLKIKGVVLEGMNPKTKIDSQVPLKGRIVVTESEVKEKEPALAKPPVRQHPKKAKSSAENLPDLESAPVEKQPVIPEDPSDR